MSDETDNIRMYSVGLIPVRFLNMRQKEEVSLNPQENVISVMLREVFFNISRAFVSRYSIRYCWGDR